MDKEKFLDKLALIEVIVILIVAIWIASINHYKSYYEEEEPLGYEEACDVYTAAGYPPGEDIPVAKSVEDIIENKYCTIEVSEKDIMPTRYFEIKDASEAGDSYSKVGRNHFGRHVDESYGLDFSFGGDIFYYTRQFGWNLDETSYGEWCSVKLESGESVYVFVDLKLLDIPTDEKIKLPIGVLEKRGQKQAMVDQCDKYGVLEGNAYWYLDMVGKWEYTEVGDLNPVMRAIVFFGIASVLACCLELLIKKSRS